MRGYSHNCFVLTFAIISNKKPARGRFVVFTQLISIV